MKYSLVLLALFSVASLTASVEGTPVEKTMEVTTVPSPTTSTINVSCPTNKCEKQDAVKNVVPVVTQSDVLEKEKSLLISVVGQGVAPMNTASPAQAYALAKRAATADAYRLIAEKVKGVRVEGQDLIQNMMVKRSSVRTSVTAMVRNANVVETTFKEGLCEVEMEITISHSQFPQ
jgi:outer membrane protein FlgP